MKSCFGLLFTVIVFTLVIGGGAMIWYLSYTTEFSRTDQAPKATRVELPANR